MKIDIQCNDLVNEYQINKNAIIKQLQTLKPVESQYFVLASKQDFRFTLMGKMQNNKIILEHIEKAIDYIKVDNSDILSL